MENHNHRPSRLAFGDITIDALRYEVLLQGRPIALTFKEFELLLHLAVHAGRVLRRQEILRDVWGPAYVGGVRTVDVHIRRLRSKLERTPEPVIQTVHKVGYKLVDRPARAHPAEGTP